MFDVYLVAHDAFTVSCHKCVVVDGNDFDAVRLVGTF